MPWKSKAQAAWGHSKDGEKALGKEGVEEFDKASKGKKLPEKAKGSKHPIHDKYPGMAEHVSRMTEKDNS